MAIAKDRGHQEAVDLLKATQPATQSALPALPAGLPPPQGLRDMGDLLAQLAPRVAKGWELSQVEYGRTFPIEGLAGQGFHILIYDTQAPVDLDIRPPWRDVDIWLMGRDYEGKAPPRRDARATEEITRWRGHRMFLCGGLERWPGRRDDVLAALKGAGPGRAPGATAAIQQRFDAFARFVEVLGSKVHPKWYCQDFRYSRQPISNPGVPQEGWGLYLFLRHQKQIGPSDPYGEAMLWLMEPSFDGKLPEKTAKNFVPDEVGRWQSGRAFLWAFARGDGNWLTVQEDLRAAMQASDTTAGNASGLSSPGTQPGAKTDAQTQAIKDLVPNLLSSDLFEKIWPAIKQADK